MSQLDPVAAEDTCVGCGNGPLSILDKHHGRRCNCCRNGHSRMYVTYDTKFRPRGAYCSECLTPLQHHGPVLGQVGSTGSTPVRSTGSAHIDGEA